MMGLFGPPNVEKMKVKGNVQGLIKALDYQKDAKVRRAAAEALGEVQDLLAVEPLITALRDTAEIVREAAATALGKLKDPRAVEPLILASEIEEGSTVCLEAIEALGQIGDERALEKLIDHIRYSDDREVRTAAVRALGQLGHPDAIGPLLHVLTKKGSDVSWEAAEAFARIGEPAVEPLCAVLRNGAIKLHGPALLMLSIDWDGARQTMRLEQHIG